MKLFNKPIKKITVDSTDFIIQINLLKQKNIIIDIFEMPIVVNGNTRRREYTIIYKQKWWFIK